MAEPFTIATGIAGLLSLAGPILAEGYAYLASVRDSPNALKQLLSEISRLDAVLGQIDELARESTTIPVQSQKSRQRVSEVITPDTIRTASDLLKSVQSSIKLCERIPGQSAKNIGRAFFWPFKEREVKESLDRFRRLITTFQLALSIESNHLLRNVNKRTAEIMDEQQEAKRQRLTLDNEFRYHQQGLKRDVNDNLLVGAKTLCNTEVIIKLGTEAKHERFQKFLEILSPLDPAKRHQDLQAKRYKGSGLWLLAHQGFREWRGSNMRTENTRNQVLQCYGIPGAGKTFISSMVIDHLLTYYGVPQVAYLYCDYRDKTNQSLLNILGSILKQLLTATTKTPDAVANVLESLRKEGRRVGVSDVLQMLKITIQHLIMNATGPFLCIDALDELESRVRLELLKAIQSEFGSMRIFLTGRPHIASDVSRMLQLRQEEAIQIIPNPIDVRAYLSHEIDLDWEMNPDDMNERLKEEIVDAIVTKAQGMFLLPALHISMVLEQPTMAKRRTALTTLPSELDDAYARMVDRIQNSRSLCQLGMRVLMWLHLATRPLRLKEIQHALAIEPGNITLDEEAIPAQKRLLDCCLGLVLVDDETSTVRFVHYTLEEYFQRHSSSFFPHGYSMAAEICLSYLNLGELSAECPTYMDMKIREATFPFFEYASCNWGHYTAQCRNNGRVVEGLAELVMNVLGSKDKRLPHAALQILYFHTKGPRDRLSYGGEEYHGCSLKLLGIHAAAYFGLETYMPALKFKNDNGWNVRDAQGRSPLSVAAMVGHEPCVRLLIEKEYVDAGSTDNSGCTPLALAAAGGHEAVVQLLVGREDVNADSTDNSGHTPLSLAAQLGYEAVVRLLAGREDVNGNSTDDNGRTPLALAAAGGHEAVVQLLVGREGVNADSTDNGGRTPLSLAAQLGYEAVVRLLAGREDVNGNSTDNNGRTPIALAASGGHVAIVRLLAHTGDVNADSTDSRGRTPLSYAAQLGHEAVVRLLADREDVNADSIAFGSRTPLSYAASEGHEAVVRLLVDREDVNPDSTDNGGRTPLSYAAQLGREAPVRLLADRGDVNADSTDYGGRTPLSYAAQWGFEAVVRLLAGRGDVDADSADSRGRTPLSYAAQWGYEGVVQLLADREDVDADSTDSRGRTPLSYAAQLGYEAVVRLLVVRGDVDAGSRDKWGFTPLSLAASGGHEAVVRLLADREHVNGDSTDDDGRTPLALAASGGHEAVVRLLADREGVNADSTDNGGRTPLSLAASGGHVAVVRLLADRGDVDADSEDNGGRTPLSYAAQLGREAPVRLLADREDVNADSTDNGGRTPLSYAAQLGREAVVRLLAGREDVNADSTDSRGRTPLSLAASGGHRAVVRLLAGRGDVNPDSTDNSGRTPLSYAAQLGYKTIVRLLADRGDVNPGSTDDGGRTPLAYADEWGYGTVVRLLADREDVDSDLDSTDKYT